MKIKMFAAQRLAYFASPGPEGPHAPERPVEAAKQESTLEDSQKRHDVYARAEQKAKELIASDDPKKQARGERMLQQVEAARSDERKMDTSMAMVTAQNLERSLQLIARREAATSEKGVRGEMVMSEETLTAKPPAAALEQKAEAAPAAQEKKAEGIQKIVAPGVPADVVARLDSVGPLEPGRTARVEAGGVVYTRTMDRTGQREYYRRTEKGAA